MWPALGRFEMRFAAAHPAADAGPVLKLDLQARVPGEPLVLIDALVGNLARENDAHRAPLDIELDDVLALPLPSQPPSAQSEKSPPRAWIKL